MLKAHLAHNNRAFLSSKPYMNAFGLITVMIGLLAMALKAVTYVGRFLDKLYRRFK